MRIIEVDDIGTTPARVNRITGDIFWNRKFDFLPEPVKKFIIHHEIGHYELQTKDEIEADNYAFSKYAGTEPYSLKNSIDAMTDVFSFQKPIHYKRLYEQYKRILKWDWENTGNAKAKEVYDFIVKNENEMNNSNFVDNEAVSRSQQIVNMVNQHPEIVDQVSALVESKTGKKPDQAQLKQFVIDNYEESIKTFAIGLKNEILNYI